MAPTKATAVALIAVDAWWPEAQDKQENDDRFDFLDVHLAQLPVFFLQAAIPPLICGIVPSGLRGKNTFIARRYPTNISPTIMGNCAIIQSEK
jgi:hypothetical protein